MNAVAMSIAVCLALTAGAGLADGRDRAGVLGKARQVQAVNGRAMSVCLEGGTLFAAAGTELYSFDVSSPLDPRPLGVIGGFDNARQIVSQDGFVYVASRETGMRIVDARDPKSMRIRSRFDSVEFATGIDVAGSVAFLSERINGVECVDVSDPDNPAHICIRKTSESQSCRYRDGWLYSGEWGSGSVTVFDARDMRNFRAVGQLDLHGYGDGVEIDGNYLYCSTGHDSRHAGLKGEEARGRGRGLDIFSIRDPAKPVWVSRVDFPLFKPRDDDYWTPRVANGLAFCCDSHNGLFVVDVKDPAKPAIVDRFCAPQPGKTWPSGAISSVAVGEGCIYVTSNPGGLFVVPVREARPPARPKGSLPRNVGFRERYTTDDSRFYVWHPPRPGQARTVCVTNGMVYAACGDAGLHVLRILENGGFERIGGLPDGKQAYDCAVLDGKLVVAEGLAGFAAYECDGAAGLREVSRRPALDKAASVAYWAWAVGGKTLILSGRRSDFCFFDADAMGSERPLLKSYGGCSWDKYVCDRALGGVLPILVPYGGVQWFDVGGKIPSMIEFRKEDRSNVGNQRNGICSLGDGFFLQTIGADYVLAGTNRVFGAASRLPFPGGKFDGIPRSDGRWVVLTGRSERRIAVFDFADPAHPVFDCAYSVSGNPDLAAFHRGRIVVPCGHQGVLLEKRVREWR